MSTGDCAPRGWRWPRETVRLPQSVVTTRPTTVAARSNPKIIRKMRWIGFIYTDLPPSLDSQDAAENRKLRAKPAACRFPSSDVLTDHLNRGCDRNCQDESDSAPEPSPEQQRNRHGQRVQMDTTSDDGRHEHVEADHVESTQHRRDSQVRADRFPL